jgi:hypothetical protein
VTEPETALADVQFDSPRTGPIAMPSVTCQIDQSPGFPARVRLGGAAVDVEALALGDRGVLVVLVQGHPACQGEFDVVELRLWPPRSDKLFPAVVFEALGP